MGVQLELRRNLSVPTSSNNKANKARKLVQLLDMKTKKKKKTVGKRGMSVLNQTQGTNLWGLEVIRTFPDFHTYIRLKENTSFRELR